MNLGGRRVVVGSMSYSGSNPTTTTTTATRKPADVVLDQFPAGLRVLVVDDDPTCLRILEKMLRTCRYEVTKCDRAEYALNELRRNRHGFDIVLSDVHMPDMDGFKLLEHIGLEMDLPVIMMSADDSKNVVMKGVTHGACDYLIKPVRIEALKNIWQHVVRKKKNEWRESFEQSGSLETDGDKQQKQDESEYTSPATEGSWKGSKRKGGGEDDDGDDKDDTATLKKPRVVWSVELHQQFVAAVNQLGIDKAVPKKILELMNVPGLTRENVASHLQKYRLYLRRLSGVSPHPGGPNGGFMGPNDPSFGALSALGGIDLQTLAVAGQIPPQTLAAYQPGLSRPTIKPGMSMPFIDQRNLFSFETPKLRFGDGQQHLQHLNNTGNSNKQMNLLHGIPTNMEPKHLAGFHPSPQSMASMNLQTNPQVSQSGSLLIPMVQNQAISAGQMMGQTGMGSSHPIPQIQSSICQTMPSAGSSSVAGLPRSSNLVEIDRGGVGYGSAAQSSSVVDFSVNHHHHVHDLPGGNGFPIASTPTVSSLTSKGLLQQEDINNNAPHATKGLGPRGYNPNYDMFNELSHRQKLPQDWNNSNNNNNNNAGLNYGSGSHQQASTAPANSVNVSPSVLVNNQGYSSGQRHGRNGNADLSKSMYLSGTEQQRPMGSAQNASNVGVCDNFVSRVKTERDQELSTGSNNIYPYQYGQDDLMSAILKQQDTIGPVEGEFDFDGYTLDNIPV